MLANRVQETTTSTGTGNLTLAGAAANYQTFNAAFGLNRLFRYFIVDDANVAWEYGIGYLTASTTLVRETVIESTNAGAAVNFGGGTKTVFCDAGSGSTVLGKLKSDRWSRSLHVTDPQSNGQTLSANKPYWCPFWWGHSNSLVELGFYVSSAGTGGSIARIALAEDVDGLPSKTTHIWQSADIAIDTTGAKSATITPGIDLSDGRAVWAGIVTNSNVEIIGYSDGSAGILVGVNALSVYPWPVKHLHNFPRAWTDFPVFSEDFTEYVNNAAVLGFLGRGAA